MIHYKSYWPQTFERWYTAHVISDLYCFVDLSEVTGLMGRDREDSESSEQPSVNWTSIFSSDAESFWLTCKVKVRNQV